MTTQETGYYILGAGLLWLWYNYEPEIQIDPALAIQNKSNILDTDKGYLQPAENDMNNLLTFEDLEFTSVHPPDTNIDLDVPPIDIDFGMTIPD